MNARVKLSEVTLSEVTPDLEHEPHIIFLMPRVRDTALYKIHSSMTYR